MPTHRVCRCGGTGWDGCVPSTQPAPPPSTTIEVLREANRRDEANRVTLADLWADTLGHGDGLAQGDLGIGWNSGFPALSAAGRDLSWDLLSRQGREVE